VSLGLAAYNESLKKNSGSDIEKKKKAAVKNQKSDDCVIALSESALMT
jgi:hypothetical protein